MAGKDSSNSKEDPVIYSEQSVGSRITDVKTFKKLIKVFEIARKSVCKVKPAHKDQGTGAFFEESDCNAEIRFLFMTCNHVLPTNSLKEISQAIIEFEDIQQMTNYSWNNDIKQVKYIWTSRLFDATVIEISSDLANLFKSYGVRFLKIGQVTAKVQVAILQYPNGKFGIAHGEIDHMNGHDVFYQIATAPGSSGSPLLDWNCNALAMHKAGAIGATEEKPDIYRKASSMAAIIDAYFKDQTNDTLLCVNCIFKYLIILVWVPFIRARTYSDI